MATAARPMPASTSGKDAGVGTLPGGCRCSYAPVMTYQGEAGAAVAAPAEAE